MIDPTQNIQCVGFHKGGIKRLPGGGVGLENGHSRRTVAHHERNLVVMIESSALWPPENSRSNPVDPEDLTKFPNRDNGLWRALSAL